MSPLFDLVAGILAAFYSAIPNYAVAIILLTVLVMAITTPLTLKSTRSMMMMQQLQPEMKRIQARFKDDRQKANEEMLKFYKENNINPLGGCIPLLVQMPVFFFLYAVLRGLTRRVSDVGFSVGYVGGQSAVGVPLNNPPVELLPFDPAFLNHSSSMYQSLSQTTTMSAPPLNIDLSESMVQAWGRGALAAAPYILLIAVVGFTSFYQQRQIQGRNPNQQVNPQTQTMMKIMPIILPVISLNLAAGLVLYFAVSNIWRVGLQGFISRSIYGIKRGQAGDSGGGAKALAGSPSDDGGGGRALMPWSRRNKEAADDTAPAAKGPPNGNGRNGAKQPAKTNKQAANKQTANKSSNRSSNKSSTRSSTRSSTNGSNGKSSTNGRSTSQNPPAKKQSAKNPPAKNPPAKNPPAKNPPAKNPPAKQQPTKQQPTKPSPAKPSPAKPSPAEQSSTESQSKAAPAKNTPAMQPRARRPKKR